jgi:hypothetical protein
MSTLPPASCSIGDHFEIVFLSIIVACCSPSSPNWLGNAPTQSGDTTGGGGVRCTLAGRCGGVSDWRDQDLRPAALLMYIVGPASILLALGLLTMAVVGRRAPGLLLRTLLMYCCGQKTRLPEMPSIFSSAYGICPEMTPYVKEVTPSLASGAGWHGARAGR